MLMCEHSFGCCCATPHSAREEQFSALRWIKTLSAVGYSYWRKMWTLEGIAKIRCCAPLPPFWLTGYN